MKHKNLASERVRLGMSQTDLACELGVDLKTVSLYENGKRSMSPEFLTAAADLFGCSIDYLLDRTPERVPRPA